MELLLTKTASGALVPVDDEQAEKLRKVKLGQVVRCEITQMRNGGFHRKWFSLARLAFDLWSETMPAQEYNGRPVMPNFDRFRRDLTILAGHAHPVWNVRGELRVEADSLKWAEMDEETFEKLFSATIDVILRSVLPNSGLTPERLRQMAERVVEYA